jgi:hypothetical protein
MNSDHLQTALVEPLIGELLFLAIVNLTSFTSGKFLISISFYQQHLVNLTRRCPQRMVGKVCLRLLTTVG